MSHIEPKVEQIQTFASNADDSTPIVMINLLRYREQAAYAADSGAEACSGREAYQRYSAVALQKVAEVGGRPIWLGACSSTVIGPEAEEWDDAVLVEYPSKKAFLSMVSNPEYLACSFHRTAALVDSRLIATESAMQLLKPMES